MNGYSKDTMRQANQLVNSMRKGNVQAFQDSVFTPNMLDTIQRMVKLAKEYCTLQERRCNGELYKTIDARETSLERRILDIAVRFDLKVEFSGDPRGFCVKLHAPSKDVYNTWGGKESGYGIG